MVKQQLIDKKKAVINGKYAVLFKATPEIISFVQQNSVTKQFADNVDVMLEETKNPLLILDFIHQASQFNFIQILKQIQTNKNLTWDDLRAYEEFYLWYYYEYFTKKLIEGSVKIIEKLDINQLLIGQAQHNQGIWEKALKQYQELGVKIERQQIPKSKIPEEK